MSSLQLATVNLVAALLLNGPQLLVLLSTSQVVSLGDPTQLVHLSAELLQFLPHLSVFSQDVAVPAAELLARAAVWLSIICLGFVELLSFVLLCFRWGRLPESWN